MLEIGESLEPSFEDKGERRNFLSHKGERGNSSECDKECLPMLTTVVGA